MTRFRLPMSRLVFLGLATLVMLVLLLPMRLALGWFGVGDTGLTARAAEGSIWTGRLTEARFRGAALGDVDAGLSPLQLIVGRARLGLERRAGGAADAFTGALGLSARTVGVDDVTGTVPVGSLFAPLPVGALGFDDVTVRFASGQCRNAEGRVRAMLTGQVAGLNLAGGLQGNARCDGGALLLPLASASGAERIEIRLAESGAYTADLIVATADPGIATGLAAAGFRPGEGGYRLSVTRGN